MSAIVREAVRVVVPATSANLGPAFDCAGLALGLHDELVAMASDDEGVLVDVSGEGEDAVPRDGTHLVVRAMRAGFTRLGAHPEGFVLRCRNAIPHGRGLGSSAAAIVGGIVLARAMVDDGAERMTDQDVLDVALGLEPHPDNLAAAIHGGLTLAWTSQDGARAERLEVHASVHPFVVIPPGELSTASARAMLPAQVALADAVANVGRSALLVHALTTDPACLLDATEDRLHQDARRGAYPDSLRLVERLRAAGIPAAISGAGPTVVAFGGEGIEETLSSELGLPGWRLARLPVDTHGARVVPLAPLP